MDKATEHALPDAMIEPVRMKTPASAATDPTVGANCRGGITADAIGWLELGADGRWRHRGGFVRRNTYAKYTNTHGFTQVQGPREEVRPLLLPV